MFCRKLDNFKKTPAAAALLTALFFGLIIHLFGMINVLHNYDDICVQPYGVGTTIQSGRWFLGILAQIGQYSTWNYNVHWINSLALLALLSLCAASLSLVLKIRSRKFAAILGAAFVTFPSVTAIFFFKYTAPHYGLAILMSLCAVWITEHRRYGFFPAIFLIACATGIYQGYFPLAVALYLILLLRKALEAETGFADIVKKGLIYLGTMLGGLAVYFAALKVCLKFSGVELNSYQGINNMGSVSLNTLPARILNAAKDFLLFPKNHYCQLSGNLILNLCYYLLGLLSAALVIFLIVKHKKKPLEIVAICCLCALLPISINLIAISNAEWIYTLMVLPFVLVLYLPITLWELAMESDPSSGRWKLLQKTVLITFAFILFFNSYYANVNYLSLYYSNRQVENTMTSVVSQAYLQPGYTVSKEWVFIGDITTEALDYPVWGEYHLYGGNVGSIRLINEYSRLYWISLYLGHEIPTANQSAAEAVEQMPEVQEMPAWPNNGSVRVIGEYVVVKFS